MWIYDKEINYNFIYIFSISFSSIFFLQKKIVEFQQIYKTKECAVHFLSCPILGWHFIEKYLTYILVVVHNVWMSGNHRFCVGGSIFMFHNLAIDKTKCNRSPMIFEYQMLARKSLRSPMLRFSSFMCMKEDTKSLLGIDI